MQKFYFSCLISCYYKDSPSQLIDSLNSIYNQTLSANEIVFVKDGLLTDDLEAVLVDFSKKMPIKVVELIENKGLGNALHQGLKECSYDYIIRMDTDDICTKNRFERLINFIKENNEVDIVGSWAKDIDNDGNIVGERRMPTIHKDIYKLIWTCPFIHPTIAFKKASIIKIGSYSTTIKRRQDYDLWFRAAKGGLKFANIPEFLLKYRFTESFYKKNNLKVSIQQSKMGIRGLLKLKSFSIIAYVGVLSPILRSVLPNFIAIRVHKFFQKIDPRKK